MFYEITVPAGATIPPGVNLIHDNPTSARETLQDLYMFCGRADFAVLRNGVKLSDEELGADIESYEIAQVRENSSQLPSTYRPGWGVRTDDVAAEPDGNPVRVWGPENPEDRFDQ
jgi:hypothetical protein